MRKAQSETTRKFYVAVGKKIADARKRFPKTQEALAADLKVNRATVVNMERGRQQLLLHTIVRVARSLNVAAESLIPEYTFEDIAITNFVNDPNAVAWIEESLNADEAEVSHGR